MFEPYDELVLMNMGQYDRKNLCSIEKVLAEDASDTEAVGKSSDCLSQDEANNLSGWAEKTLGPKVKKVKVRPPASPCLTPCLTFLCNCIYFLGLHFLRI